MSVRSICARVLTGLIDGVYKVAIEKITLSHRFHRVEEIPLINKKQWIILVVLAVIELISAFYLASLNPVRGYDENWYLINAHRYQGVATLPYAFNRPPILSMLLAIFGDFRWMISALCHIGSTVVLFIILRRFVSPAVAIGGTILFMICGDIRLYNVLMLTEMPSIFFMLLSLYFFHRQRHFLTGLLTALSMLTHWSMATAVPVFALLFIMNKQWRGCLYFTSGVVFSAVPFLFIAAVVCGNPIVGALVHFVAQQNGENDWWYYLREFPQIPVALKIGGIAALLWVWIYWKREKNHPVMIFCVLMLGMIFARMILLQFVAAKGSRYLIPLIPLLVLLSMTMFDFYRHRGRLISVCLWGAMILSVMPDKTCYYQMYNLAHDPTHLIDQFQDDLAAIDPAEPIYTDFHDLAVMGHTARRTFPVVTEFSWHHRAWDTRRPHRREDIPNGALYLTWDPEGGELLATSEKTKRGRLCLVRWQEGTGLRKVSYP